MKHYVSIQNSVLFQVSLLDTEIPDGNWTEITKDIFDIIVNSDGTLTGIGKVCSASIDVEAGNARSKYITTSPGQAEVYISKAIYAKEIVTANYQIDIAKYPLITSEMTRLKADLINTCKIILATEAFWQTIAAKVEDIRLGFKTRVGSYSSISLLISDYINSIYQLRMI